MSTNRSKPSPFITYLQAYLGDWDSKSEDKDPRFDSQKMVQTAFKNDAPSELSRIFNQFPFSYKAYSALDHSFLKEMCKELSSQACKVEIIEEEEKVKFKPVNLEIEKHLKKMTTQGIKYTCEQLLNEEASLTPDLIRLLKLEPILEKWKGKEIEKFIVPQIVFGYFTQVVLGGIVKELKNCDLIVCYIQELLYIPKPAGPTPFFLEVIQSHIQKPPEIKLEFQEAPTTRPRANAIDSYFSDDLDKKIYNRLIQKISDWKTKNFSSKGIGLYVKMRHKDRIFYANGNKVESRYVHNVKDLLFDALIKELRVVKPRSLREAIEEWKNTQSTSYYTHEKMKGKEYKTNYEILCIATGFYKKTPDSQNLIDEVLGLSRKMGSCLVKK